jgi:peroxiredoxin
MRQMYRNLGIILVFFYIYSTIYCQNSTEIIQKSYVACQNIQMGSYKMSGLIKFLTERDTMFITSGCQFKKIKDDSIFPAKFHYYISFNHTPPGEYLYNGDELITTNPTDSTGMIRLRSKLPKNFQTNKSAYLFFEPYLYSKNFLFFLDSMLLIPGISIQQVNDEIVKSVKCHHFLISVPPDQLNNIGEMKTLGDKFEYWTSVTNYLPYQYSITQMFVKNSDTLVVYRKYWITDLVLDQPISDSLFSIASLPRQYKFMNYELPKTTPLLSPGLNAPEWILFSTTGERQSLKDFNEKVVILDFFYKSCYPCLLAMTNLIDLQNKYRDLGVIILGIDPIDKNAGELNDFLKGKGVNYPILLGTKEVIGDYKVSSYPTLYLIDKKGKILFNMAGYGVGYEAVIENFIIQAIK